MHGARSDHDGDDRGCEEVDVRRRWPPPRRPAACQHAPERSADAARGRPRSPSCPTRTTGLTRRQQAILDVIRDSVERRGYPPSIREICESAGLASTSSVAHQLAMLERKGFLRRDPNRPRAVDVRSPGEPLDGKSAASGPLQRRRRPAATPPSSSRWSAASRPAARSSPSRWSRTSSRCRATLVGEGTLFMLKVAGDSMIEAAIADGDWVVVRQQHDADERRHRGGDDRRRGDGQDATVGATGTSGCCRTTPPTTPIPADDATILGRVVAVLRKV